MITSRAQAEESRGVNLISERADVYRLRRKGSGMNTIVLSALPSAGASNLTGALEDALRRRGGEIRWVGLDVTDFRPCMTCGGCERTGRCVLNDEMSEIIAEVASCDRLVLVTPLFLGVHAPLMKKAVDRFLPLGGGLFTIRGGEMHHRLQMKRRFSIVGVGVAEDGTASAEAGIFELLIGRHAVNLACPRHAAVIISPERDADAVGEFIAALDRTERAS